MGAIGGHDRDHRVEPLKVRQIDPRQLPLMAEGIFHPPAKRDRGVGLAEVGNSVSGLVQNVARPLELDGAERRVLTENRAQRRGDQGKPEISALVADQPEIVHVGMAGEARPDRAAETAQQIGKGHRIALLPHRDDFVRACALAPSGIAVDAGGDVIDEPHRLMRPARRRELGLKPFKGRPAGVGAGFRPTFVLIVAREEYRIREQYPQPVHRRLGIAVADPRMRQPRLGSGIAKKRAHDRQGVGEKRPVRLQPVIAAIGVVVAEHRQDRRTGEIALELQCQELHRPADKAAIGCIRVVVRRGVELVAELVRKEIARQQHQGRSRQGSLHLLERRAQQWPVGVAAVAAGLLAAGAVEDRLPLRRLGRGQPIDQPRLGHRIEMDIRHRPATGPRRGRRPPPGSAHRRARPPPAAKRPRRAASIGGGPSKWSGPQLGLATI